MFKRCLIIFLLAASQLSAETVVTTKEPVKKSSFSYRQKVIVCSAAFIANFAAGMIFGEAMSRCLFYKNIGMATRAKLLGATLGGIMVLLTIEEKFLEKYPDFFWPCEDSETKQENVPC